jgi:hypothetical protein
VALNLFDADEFCETRIKGTDPVCYEAQELAFFPFPGGSIFDVDGGANFNAVLQQGDYQPNTFYLAAINKIINCKR